MFSSMPDYRRFAEAALQRLRKDPTRKTCNRWERMLLNVVLVTGLWGVPLYARWVVLSDIDRPEDVAEGIVGKWRATDGSHFSIAFTAEGQFVLSWKETIVETARYWFNDGKQDEIVLADFREPPDERPIEEEGMWWFQVFLEGKKLSITHSHSLHEQWRRRVPWHSSRQIEGERFDLLPAVFERAE